MCRLTWAELLNFLQLFRIPITLHAIVATLLFLFHDASTTISFSPRGALLL